MRCSPAAGLVVSLSAVCVLVGGCYATRMRGGRDGGGPPADAPRAPDVTAPEDAAPTQDVTTRPDAGSDAGACVPIDERDVRACVLTPTGTIPAGEAFELPVTRSRCLCGGRACDVRVDADRIELALRTCEREVDCDDCTFEATCVLPPMMRGERALWLDGVLAGRVVVAPPEVVREARPACLAIPEPPDGSLVCTGAVVPRAGAAELCHRGLEDVGAHARFTWTASCGACSDWSAGCEAQREDARTIVLRPRLQACDCPSCGACEPSCAPRSVTCETPPLRAGRYTIVVERAPAERATVSTLEVRDVELPGPVTCTVAP
jgi:hypothetical protein